MNNDEKMGLNSRLFGPAYAQDERVRASVDKAGLNCFLVLMAGLFICITAGLLLKYIELMVISGAFFLIGCISYLLFMVKVSAFSFDTQDSDGKTKKKLVFALIFGCLIFGVMDFLLNVYSNPDNQMAISSIAGMSLIKALLWGVLMLVMFKGLNRWSEKRLEKKIKEGEGV